MANEATLIVRTAHPYDMTVANGTGIEKGTLLKLTDPNTAIINSATNDAVAGIAASEKIANDGVTKLAVYREGRFKVTLSGSCTVGDALVLSSTANHVLAAPNAVTLSGTNIIGIALETGTNTETILMELKPYTQRNN
jgi:hypothetical protein